MNKPLALALIAATLLIAGCATAGKTNLVRIGMTKDEVIKVMGSPASISAKGQIEYLNYWLSETPSDGYYGINKQYFVRLVDGKVEAFGRVGDFDSTKTPTVRVESDQTTKQDITVREK